MKITTKVGVLLLLMVTAFSCNDLDELTEFDVTQDFSRTFNVSVPEGAEGEPQSINQTSTIDITANQAIEQNIDLVQDISKYIKPINSECFSNHKDIDQYYCNHFNIYGYIEEYPGNQISKNG